MLQMVSCEFFGILERVKLRPHQDLGRALALNNAMIDFGREALVPPEICEKITSLQPFISCHVIPDRRYFGNTHSSDLTPPLLPV